jgi:diguanylate cyclase (GGDEF)-like protein
MRHKTSDPTARQSTRCDPGLKISLYQTQRQRRLAFHPCPTCGPCLHRSTIVVCRVLQTVKGLAYLSSDRPALGEARPVAPERWPARLSASLLSTDPRRRIRITQWLVTALVYATSALAVLLALRPGAENHTAYLYWCAFLASLLTCIYVALRSGWSERFADPALTTTQILLGVTGVEWAYLICGPARGATLYPLLLIFAFGAFSLSWRRIMWLTLWTLASLIVTVAALAASRQGGLGNPLNIGELHLDTTNVLMMMIVLPALSVIAGKLSILRSKLRSQRSALYDAVEEVQRLATHDDLTGLVNRRYMQQQLLQEQRRFQRRGKPFSVAIIDLDFFKRINDTQGHASGDKVLQAFAAQALATLRESDLIARWGGEEFLALLPDTPAAQGVVIIQRLLKRMNTMPHAMGTKLTFSAGVTESRQSDTVEEVIARADAAMYEAKHAGRNTVRLKELTA